MTYEPLPAFASWSGPRDAKLVIVGEAWGLHEFEMKKPFVGESGKELFSMLGEAAPALFPELHREVTELFKYGLAWNRKKNDWLYATGIALTNTLAFRPHNNDVLECCVDKKSLPSWYDYPAIEKARYLDPEYLPELDRLKEEIETCKPNLVLAVGAKASWALLQDNKIGSIRGGISQSTLAPGYKVLPTYHPAGVLRNWSWRPIVVADLMKAMLEKEFPDVRRPSRTILYSPTLQEVIDWCYETMNGDYPMLGADTETSRGQITMISIARTPHDCLVVPFIDDSKPGKSYWATANEEIEAWNWIAALLESKAHEKVWQNGVYDLQYILPLGIKAGAEEDTMLLHHSILPEMQKGLGFLGSIYTSEPAWKLMRTRKSDTVKRDE